MNNFYVISNAQKDEDFRIAKRVCEYIRDNGRTANYQTPEANEKYNSANPDRVPENTECVIVIGGDGTLIQAARDLADISVPVFGINIGNIGYLTEIDMDQATDAINLLMKDEYFIDKRMLLTGDVYRGDKLLYSNVALNDIVVSRAGSLKIIDFDIYVNGEFLITYPADGIIIATPTGSTAYNLSAGGPIVIPQTECMVMTPVCPHMLNKSSVVFGGEDQVEIRMVPSRNDIEERVVTFDGSDTLKLLTGDKIVIKKSETSSSFVRTRAQNFLQILRKKLS